MEIVHVYQRKRAEFGRQCNFDDRSAQMLADIKPNPEMEKEYLVRDPVEFAIQNTKEYSEHEVNTETVTSETRGIYHTEGGWPKDVNPAEADQVSRFRKKVEKTPEFQQQIIQTGLTMEHAIRQNNAVDIYENYFESESENVAVAEPPSIKTVNVYRDPCDQKRSVSAMSWYPDQATKLAVAYSILEFQKAPEGISTDSYIWNVERPNAPEMTLTPSSPLVSIEYNMKDVNVLLAGQYNGQIAVFDTRKGSRPVEVSPIEKSHRDPVYRARYLATKTGTDAFSCSSDGQVMFWDVRKLSEPTETLMIDPDDNGRLLGGVSLEYESTMPAKFQVGTEQGKVVLFNRKGKTPQEKISCTYNAHLGPVYACERNPFFPKFFLTVGDWSMRTWCEDIRESAIMWTKYNQSNLTDGCWSPSRPAVCFSSKADGTLDVWDLLFKTNEPTLSMKVSDSSIQSIKVDSSGKYVACGGHDGTISLLELSNALSDMQPNEKPNTSAVFERETDREKTVVARLREVHLKESVRIKTALASAKEGGDEGEGEKKAMDEVDPITDAENQFYKAIEASKKKRAQQEEKKKAAATAATAPPAGDEAEGADETKAADEAKGDDDAKGGDASEPPAAEAPESK
jgi:dynein intermediate chain 2